MRLAGTTPDTSRDCRRKGVSPLIARRQELLDAKLGSLEATFDKRGVRDKVDANVSAGHETSRN